MKITLERGRPALFADDGKLLFKDITCGVSYKGEDGEVVSRYVEGEWTVTELEGGYVASCQGSDIIFVEEGEGFTVRCMYTHAGEDIPALEDFIVLFGKIGDNIRKLVNPEIREVNGNRTNEMLAGMYTVDFVSDGQNEQLCGDFGAFITDRGEHYIAGFLTADEYFSGVNICRNGTIEARAFAEHHALPCGKTLTSDVFHITPVCDVVRGLHEFCDTAVKYMDDKPRLDFDVPSGFCTWYYYLGEISDSIITRSAEEMAANSAKLPVRYVQIDDGWQKCYGQWEENEKFASGMKACADKIISEGFLPGLWFAPLWARFAQVAKDHPEYFAKDRRTGEQTLCFDYSVKGTCDYMSEVFRRATYDWGYKYLKLDLMTTCLGDYVYSDPDFNSLKNYKKCMTTIRDSVPEDTFLLACTAPFLPSAGIVHGIRSSCDIFGDWNSLLEVMNRTLKRYYYHKKFFFNDADCLIIRKSENEDSECQRQCTRNDEEIKSYISATAATGGILMFSDKLSLLSADQTEMLSYLFPQNTDAALPLDLTETIIPRVLDCGVRGDLRTVILINWDDKENTVSFKAGGIVFEFWSRSDKGYHDVYSTDLRPHCCEVLFVSQKDTPSVIGTDSRLIPTINSSYEDGKLTVEFAKENESLFVAASSLECDTCEVIRISDGLYKITGTSDKMTACLTASL